MFGLALFSGVNTEDTLKGFKTTFNTSPPSKPQSLWTRFHLQIPTVWSFLLKSLNWKPKPLNDHGSPTSEEITLMYYQPKTALTGPSFCASLRHLKILQSFGPRISPRWSIKRRPLLPFFFANRIREESFLQIKSCRFEVEWFLCANFTTDQNLQASLKVLFINISMLFLIWHLWTISMTMLGTH